MARKEIDKAKFEELLNAGHSKVEIRSYFNVSDKTLSVWVYSTYQKKFSELSTLKAGRPKVSIDKALFEQLCMSQCNIEEICRHLKVDDKTLNRWVVDTYDYDNSSTAQHAYALVGKGAIKLAQFKMAQQSPEFSKWWGKQYLGQKDVVEQEIKAVVNDTHSQIIDKLSSRVDLNDGDGDEK